MLVMLCLLKMRIVWFLNRACSSGSLPSGAVYVRSSNTRRSPCACATGADGSTRPTARPARKTIANPPRDFLFSDMGPLLRGQHRVTRCVEAMEGAIVAQSPFLSPFPPQKRQSGCPELRREIAEHRAVAAVGNNPQVRARK